MIPELVKRWDANKHQLREKYYKEKPSSYADIVKDVITLVQGPRSYKEVSLDPERITSIDHGDYQGTELFIIASQGYQPSVFYSVAVAYGSCSGCDTLQAIDWDYRATDRSKAVDAYMTLALHILQAIKLIEVESV